MRLATVTHEGFTKIVSNQGGRLVDLHKVAPDMPGSVMEILAADTSLPALADKVALARPDASLSPDEVTFLPPVPNPGKILCLGLNYKDHALELGLPIPEFPIVFMRSATSLAAHGAPMLVPRVSDQFDFEAELAVVIGKAGRNIPEDNAHDHIGGVACFNDGSIRDLQMRSSQWTPGKNCDATGGFGPDLVTLDELPDDPDNLDICCRLNGVEVQRSNTNQHVFSVKQSIALISTWMTLEPGDVIILGTPSGVGMARDPKLWMKAGDVCEVEIEGIGVLSNPIALGA